MNKVAAYFGKGVSDLQRWSKAHPVKAVMFPGLCLGLFGISLMVDDCKTLVLILWLLSALYVTWALVFSRDLRRLVSVVLALAIMANPRPLKAAPYVIGGAFVLIIGGIIYYKAKKACKKISRSQTNSWPEELNFVVAGQQDEYAAGFFWPEEPCYQERRLGTAEVEPVRFTMNIFVESKTNCTVSLTAQCGSQFVETWDECKEWAAGKGLFVPDSPQFLECYARNLQPVAAESVPIKFDFDTKTATVGAGGVLLTVESSDDLKAWHHLARLNVGVGCHVESSDVSSERQFYRVTTK